ncbi:MAG: hypothetical protein DDT19_01599 [Syntrophomonadaceae bacterium]|nr:hypothetical protein [Bacillota bacterium]
MWPRSSDVGDLPVEPIKTVVIAEIVVRSVEKPQIILSDNTHTPKPEAVAESEPEKDDITTEEKTRKSGPTQTYKPSTTSSESHMGDVVGGDSIGERNISAAP